MNLTRTLEQVLRYVEPVLVAVLILRLAAQGLLLRYRAFGAYLLIWLGQDTLPLLLGLSLEGNAYARFFFISEPVAWLFLFLILYELFDLTFASFPGVRSAGKLLLTAAVLIAVLVATGTALPSLMSSHTRVGLLNFYFVIERSVMLVMLILLGALQYLMVHFRLQLPRNTVVYSTTYAIYFAMRALEILLMSELGTNAGQLLNVVAMIVDTACLLAWMLLLNRSGAATPIVAGRPLQETEQQRLREQLVAVNRILSRRNQKTRK